MFAEPLLFVHSNEKVVGGELFVSFRLLPWTTLARGGPTFCGDRGLRELSIGEVMDLDGADRRTEQLLGRLVLRGRLGQPFNGCNKPAAWLARVFAGGGSVIETRLWLEG